MRMRVLGPLAALLTSASLATALEPSPQPTARPVVVAFPAVPLPPGARVVGASLSVRGAFIVSVDGIPLGWSLTVSMDPPCCPELAMSFHHGAEALRPDEPLALRLRLEPVAGSGLLRVSAAIEYTLDFTNFKRVPLSMQQLVVRPVSSPGP